LGKTYTYFHDELLPVILGQPSEIYLRSVNQKRLFAKKRRVDLKKAIAKYSQKEEVSIEGDYTLRVRRATSFAIEIEFDHCIVSLRSCIEHLLQLINHVASLGLVPTSYNRSDRVDIDNVIHCLKSRNDAVLNRLGDYLDKEKQEDWYKTLHRLRIEMYHNKFERFIAHGEEIKIELPNGQKVNLVTYCNTVINNLERILTYSMRSLTAFLNLVP
jgi:hypothetical protein